MASKFNGVVYTKRWVVDLILDVAGYTVDKTLYNQRVCEPSCGEGAFLASIVERLVRANENAGRSFDMLAECVVAFDTDENAISHSKAVVIEKLNSMGCDNNVAKELADGWIKQADFVLEPSSKFDYVIGNPPYLRSTEINTEAREKYCAAISSMTKGCDLFIAFIQKGIDQLADEGNLTYICADRWLQNQYGKSLRRYLVDNSYSIDSLIRMHGVDAFDEEVDAYPAITKLSKSGGKLRYVNCETAFSENDVESLERWLFSDTETIDTSSFSAAVMDQIKDDSVLPLSSPARVRMIRQLVSRFPSLEESGVSLGIGMATGNDKVFIVDNPDIVEDDRLLPVFSIKDYRRHIVKDRWLVNPWTAENTLIDLDDFPKTKSYFEQNREELSKRHVAKKGAWYRTIDKPKLSIMGKPMLLFPDLASSSDPVYSDGTKYPCHNCYWLVSEEWDLKVLGGLLMSDIAEAFIEALCVKMRGGTLRFQAQYLRLIHIPRFESISLEVKQELSNAFVAGDRTAASLAARFAYGLED